MRGHIILDEELFQSVRYLILDEADMLLDGSYQQEIDLIQDAFKLSRRHLVRDGTVEVHQRTIQNILAAATIPTMGLRSIDAYVKKRFPLVRSYF